MGLSPEHQGESGKWVSNREVAGMGPENAREWEGARTGSDDRGRGDFWRVGRADSRCLLPKRGMCAPLDIQGVADGLSVAGRETWSRYQVCHREVNCFTSSPVCSAFSSVTRGGE